MKNDLAILLNKNYLDFFVQCLTYAFQRKYVNIKICFEYNTPHSQQLFSILHACLFQVDFTTHRRGERVRICQVFLQQTLSIMIDNKHIKDEGYLIVRKDVALDLFVNCQPGVRQHIDT